MLAAADLLREAGLGAVTMSAVADRVGVSRATVHRHFSGGRDEVLDALVVRELHAFVDVLAAAFGRTTSLSDALAAALSDGHAALAANDLFLAALASDQAELSNRLWAADQIVADRLGDMIRARLDPESGRRDEDEAWIRHLFLSLVGNPGSWDLTDAGQVDEVVRTVLLGGVETRER